MALLQREGFPAYAERTLGGEPAEGFRSHARLIPRIKQQSRVNVRSPIRVGFEVVFRGEREEEPVLERG